MKQTRRLLPYSLCDIQGLEHWFEEMARRGYFLDHISHSQDMAVFHSGPPRELRYRLDPVGEYCDGGERKQLYAREGWDFVADIPRLFYIFSCADPAKPELHTDPAVLAYALGRTIRRQLILQGLLLAVVFLLLVEKLRQLRWSMLLDILLGDTTLWAPVYLAVLITVLLAAVSAPLIRLLRAWRVLSRGLPLKQGRRWTRPPYLPILLLLFLTHFLIGSHQATLDQRQFAFSPSQELSLTHDFPTLLEVEATGGRPGPHTPISENRRTAASYWVPVQEYCNSGTQFQYEGAYFHTRLQVQFFQARDATLARWSWVGLKDKWDAELNQWATFGWRGYRAKEWEIQPGTYTGFTSMEHPGFDALSVARFRRMYRDSWCFVGRRGTQVVAVLHTGSGSLEQCLDLFARRLDTQEDPFHSAPQLRQEGLSCALFTARLRSAGLTCPVWSAGWRTWP